MLLLFGQEERKVRTFGLLSGARHAAVYFDWLSEQSLWPGHLVMSGV